MFNPESDRIEYGRELMPPEGFHFVRAVATTYSMDFETLIAALVPLVLRGDIEDEELRSNPVAILQAVRKAVGRLVVFCEAGQIKPPQTGNRLASLLDNVIVQVALPRNRGCYPSFHPKTWLIEYENEEGEHRWRFIVLSRNLTKDHSWDVSVSLEGEMRTGSYGATKCLVPFYEFLRGRVFKGVGTERQKKIVNDIMSSLNGVSFFCEDPFEGFDIIPMGIPGLKPVDIFRASEAFDDIVVMSPFLSPKLIRMINSGGKDSKKRKRILISRADALGRLESYDVDRFKKYILRGVTTEAGDTSDLHAKVYLRRYGSWTELWLGSANATTSGMERNVEMMVRLECPNRYLNADKFLFDICGADPNDKASALLEVDDVRECSGGTEENDERRKAEALIKEICRLKIAGRVLQEGHRYIMWLILPNGASFSGVSVRPVNVPGSKIMLSGGGEVVFPGLMELEDLSSLFVFSVEYDGGLVERVIKVPVDGIPETRDDVVLNKIVADRSTLLRYVTMLLASNPALALRRLNEGNMFFSGNDESKASERVMSGIYEEMLIAAAENPWRIRDVGEILSKIRSDDEMIARCVKMYESFAEAVGLKFSREVEHE